MSALLFLVSVTIISVQTPDSWIKECNMKWLPVREVKDYLPDFYQAEAKGYGRDKLKEGLNTLS